MVICRFDGVRKYSICLSSFVCVFSWCQFLIHVEPHTQLSTTWQTVPKPSEAMTETTVDNFDAKSWVCVGYRKQKVELPKKMSDFKSATFDDLYDKYWDTEWDLFVQYVTVRVQL